MSIATYQDPSLSFAPFFNLSRQILRKESIGQRRLPVSHRQVRKHAKGILRFLSQGSSYKGEVFLCGGVYKRLINPSVKINDVDLWVRNRKERDALRADLLNRGARLVRDFHPYCILFDLNGTAIEITYQNVKDRQISEIADGSDLAACAIAATYCKGRIVDSYINASALSSIKAKTARLEEGYLKRLKDNRLPSVLRSIDRLERFAREVGYPACRKDLQALWRLYFYDYSAKERQECIDVYMDTTVNYKGQFNRQLLEQAKASVLPAS